MIVNVERQLKDGPDKTEEEKGTIPTARNECMMIILLDACLILLHLSFDRCTYFFFVLCLSDKKMQE